MKAGRAEHVWTMEEMSRDSQERQSVLTTRFGMLFHADCMDLFAWIKDDSVDCIFADPPFNLKK